MKKVTITTRPNVLLGNLPQFKLEALCQRLRYDVVPNRSYGFVDSLLSLFAQYAAGLSRHAQRL